MKTTIAKIIGGSISTLLVVLTLAFGLALAQEGTREAGLQGGGGRLEGTWDTRVTLRNCATGAAIAPTFSSIGSFMPGGTSIGSTAGRPQSSRTPEHGVWSHQSGNIYNFKFKSFNFDAAGNSTGWTIVQHQVVLDHSGDTYTSAGTGENYDSNGNLMVTLCSSATATRFQ